MGERSATHHPMRPNSSRIQLHTLAYNLANFLRTLALPPEIAQWSMSTLREQLVKIGARIVRHGQSITFQMAKVTVPRTVPENPGRQRGAAPIVAVEMLRTIARQGQPECRRATRVQTRDSGAKFFLKPRSTICRRGCGPGPSISTLKNTVDG